MLELETNSSLWVVALLGSSAKCLGFAHLLFDQLLECAERKSSVLNLTLKEKDCDQEEDSMPKDDIYNGRNVGEMNQYYPNQ